VAPTPYRRPQQHRSRESFERVVSAARDLLAERGYDTLTLADVVKASGVSIGSIYGRVSSKDDLLRLVQERILEEMTIREEQLLAPEQWEGMKLQQMLPPLLDQLAEHLRHYAPWLQAFMMRAAADETIGRTGRTAAIRFAGAFENLLLSKRSEIRHPDPQRAAHACFVIAYSTFTRYLGLGSSLEQAGQGDWKTLKGDVILSCACFMQFAEVMAER
jgi:AcrR family transcriptional regulator